LINPQNKKETAAKGCLAAVPEGFGCVLLATIQLRSLESQPPTRCLRANDDWHYGANGVDDEFY